MVTSWCGQIAAGLPELTAYFLLNEDLQPQTLYQHCNPRSRDGLITQSGPADDGEGFVVRNLELSVLWQLLLRS